MSRLYHRNLYDRDLPVGSYWEASAPPLGRETPPLEGTASCDVAVIGAGYTGLTAALTLVEQHGAGVTVLEAGTPGWGASGRNGGFCCLGGAKLGYDVMAARYGIEEMRRFFATQLEAIELVKETCRSRNIDADITGGGEILLAHRPGRSAVLRDERREMYELLGMDCTFLDNEALAERGLAAANFFGGLELPVGVGLHPLKYLRGLARAAIDAGVTLHGRSPVLQIAREAGRFVLVTPQGRLTAAKVIIATNGYSEDDRLPQLAGRLMPAQSSIIVTRPLSEAERAAQGWTSTVTCADTRRLLHYFRLLPDGRFLWGGRGGISGAPWAAQRAERHLRQSFERHFPAWRHVETEFFWRGLVCLTRPLVPFVGRLEEGLYASVAYHGNGVSFTAWAGRALAGQVAGVQGAEALPAVVRHPLPRFPFPALRKLYLAGAYALYGTQDARGLMRGAAALLTVLLSASSSMALALDDLPGWRETRWGMTAAELESALGDDATQLPGRWFYGGAYADLAVRDIEIAGLQFTAYLQMNAETDRLQQVLLERRRVGAVPAAFEQLVDSLMERLGLPATDCAQAKTGGQPLDYQLTWRFPTTTVHAKFLDFSSTAVFSRDPEAELDPLVIERKVRRNLRRFMPRRILIRYHAAARSDLDPGCS